MAQYPAQDPAQGPAQGPANESRPPVDASSRFIWPPVIYATAFCLAAFLAWRTPLTIIPEGWPAIWRWLAHGAGVFLAGMGATIALLAEIAFKKAGTAILPTRPTNAIVETGIYNLSRNPMYLGMSLALAGCALFFRDFWFALVLPLAMFAVTKLAIEPEEAYLERKFGSAYGSYKTRVRRWI